jgi:hypothetical protein
MADSHERFETPILFLIFNRPDLTQIVFDRIREVKPKYLFVAADGPREDHPEDINKCTKARNNVLANIDWDCQIKTLFRDNNLGCGLAVSQAITWFFEHVEEGIILEDDCYPSLQFFNFSSHLLDKYRYDFKIMHISGGCYLPPKIFNNSSYYFTKYPFSWGWSSWRSAWQNFSFEIADNFPYPREMRSDEINYWEGIRKKIKVGDIDTWDWRWNFSIWSQKGICISSTRNLIKNIGFEDATHTKSIPSYYKKIGFHSDVGPILEHSFSNVNSKFDRIVFEKYNLGKKGLMEKIGFLNG